MPRGTWNEYTPDLMTCFRKGDDGCLVEVCGLPVDELQQGSGIIDGAHFEHDFTPAPRMGME